MTMTFGEPTERLGPSFGAEDQRDSTGYPDWPPEPAEEEEEVRRREQEADELAAEHERMERALDLGLAIQATWHQIGMEEGRLERLAEEEEARGNEG